MCKYIFSFFYNYDGLETIEFIGILAIAAILLAIVANVGSSVIGTAGEYANSIDSALPSAP